MNKQFWFMIGIFICLTMFMSAMYKMYKPVRFETITHSNNTYSITHYKLSKHITVSLESLRNPGQPGACAVLIESREGFTKLPVECD